VFGVFDWLSYSNIPVDTNTHTIHIVIKRKIEASLKIPLRYSGNGNGANQEGGNFLLGDTSGSSLMRVITDR